MFMSEINKKIQQARPPLKVVSPLTYLMVLGFAVGNVFLAPAYLLVPPHLLVVIPNFTASILWFIAFEALAAALFYGLKVNNWQLLRRALVAGLCLKSIIMFSLIVNMFQYGISGFGTVVLWGMLSYFQAAVLVHPIPIMGATPPPKSAGLDEGQENGGK
jgi:hypothetical protein